MIMELVPSGGGLEDAELVAVGVRAVDDDD
jgi:hypothetical protein